MQEIPKVPQKLNWPRAFNAISIGLGFLTASLGMSIDPHITTWILALETSINGAVNYYVNG